MNVYDSNRIAHILDSLGYEAASSARNADIIIFNTCHIREKAAEKVFSDLGRALLVKKERAAEGKDTIIGVTGCVVLHMLILPPARSPITACLKFWKKSNARAAKALSTPNFQRNPNLIFFRKINLPAVAHS